MNDGHTIEGLELLTRRVAVAESAPDVFRILIEGLPFAAPRAAVFLVRNGQLRGWRGFGYSDRVIESLRGFSGAADASHRIREDGQLDRLSGQANPSFGQPAPVESIAMPISVKGKPIALITAERDGGEGPWHPAALSLIAHVASLRLELSLAERRARPAEAPAPSVTTSHNAPSPAPSRPAAAAPAARAAQTAPTQAAAPAPRPAPSATPAPPVMTMTPQNTPVENAQEDPIAPIAASLAATSSPGSSTSATASASATPAQDPRLEAARRFARLVATDIRLYNEQAVMLGRQHRDLAARLDEPMTLGRKSFLDRYGDLGPTAAELLQQAYVDVLAGGDAKLIPA